MENSILHIGYPKTGTTWFQKKFYPNISDIEFYDHHKLKAIIGDYKNRTEASQTKSVFNNCKKRIVVCDENMIGNAMHFNENAAYFKKVFGPCQVVIFLRNQLEKFASNYSEYIKAGGTDSVKRFLFTKGDELYGGSKHLYHNLIETYINAFGRDNIHVFLFEAFRENPVRFVHNYNEKLKLDFNSNALKFTAVNPKFSGALLKLRRISNLFTKKQAEWLNSRPRPKKYYFHIPYWYEFSYIILNKLSYFSNPSPNAYKKVLGEENLEYIHHYFCNSNRILIDKYGLTNIIKYNYPL